MSGLSVQLEAMGRRIADIERRLRSQTRVGKVVEVNAAEGLARVQINEGDQPFVTGWIPWEEPAAGANKTHNPPSVGQQVRIFSETGDLADASIQGSLNSAVNGRPSAAGDEFVMAAVGEARIAITGGGSEITLTVGGSTVTINSASISLSAARIDLN
ncbi:hypothetical protein RA27_02280 [Ruegeria sp. ANG-R]|uniref:phage baseplate assembly protein V n=1 Tax=Ruegeria sp. ANG-R TaxID=1577903 RepID=UPI00057C3B3E|nr:phage baseplate assembly protein V [Ruegeria sp. ANG-R]KIC42237.1 hypothetical protein RA27_02280 [Ruegeria sp. ANG-R]